MKFVELEFRLGSRICRTRLDNPWVLGHHGGASARSAMDKFGAYKNPSACSTR